MFEPDFEGCKYCGYAAEHHPVEHAEYYHKDGILCEEFRGREE